MSLGWIKVHRDLFESDLWHDVTTCRLFLYLIGKASHKDGRKINGVELKQGQWIRSYRKLSEDLAYKEGRGVKKLSPATIKKSVYKLIDEERVSIQETEVGTLFTVLNYASYQASEEVEKESTNASVNEVRTNGERRVNNNKNVKNVKNNKRHKFEICDMQLAELLLEKIKINFPKKKSPNLEKWANDIRLMRERDERTEEQIKYAIEWSQANDFWMANILSPEKLRKQFDSLVAQIKRERKQQPDIGPRKPRKTREQEEHLKMFGRENHG